jgi:hypothetical protein
VGDRLFIIAILALGVISIALGAIVIYGVRF